MNSSLVVCLQRIILLMTDLIFKGKNGDFSTRLIFIDLLHLLRLKCAAKSTGHIVKHFHFDLTCDLISDPKVNDFGLPWINFPGQSNAVCCKSVQ